MLHKYRKKKTLLAELGYVVIIILMYGVQLFAKYFLF